MALNIPGLVATIVFYAITLATGIWAAWKTKKEEKNANRSELAMVGGRKMNIFVGLFTAAATWIGGGYINGTAEIVYVPTRGLAWVLAPVGYVLAFIIGGLFFVKPMRSKSYVTMMDPFQETYGNTMGTLLFLPALIGDVFWFAAILSALGATMSVILDIREYLAIIISACTVILYILPGGLYSVAYTDVIQLVFMMVSLWTCVPFALLNPATESIYYTAVNEFYQVPWIGKLETEYLGRWLDELLYVDLGSIPWQIYFQRVLAASSSRQARLAFYFAGFGCVFMAIPCVLIGAVAASTDWNQTSYGLPTPNERGESSMILPIVLQYLCPTYVSVAGLGAIAAAVMSSADSALLSASSMLAHNIYRKILRKKATEKEVVCIMRVFMVVFGAAAAGLAFLSNSVYDLWFLSGELAYALLFPQLCCVLFIPNTNTYGSAAGFLFGFLLRLLAGEPSLKIPPVIHYPGCSLVDGVYIQLFPFKTFTMLLTLGTIVAVSYLVAFLFNRNILPHGWDVCSVIKESEASVPIPEIDEQAGLQINTVYINPTEIHT